jgi:thiol-disulfide isomerase/thioredoxin
MTGRRLPALRPWSTLWIGGAIALAWSATATLARPADDTPTVESVLRKTADFYKKAKSIAVEVERAQKIGGPEIKSTLKAAFQRPNRLAVRIEGEGAEMQIVSDGKSQFVSIGPLKKYTEAKAPASLDSLSTEPMALGLLQGSNLVELVADDPYAKLMEGVTSTKYAGTEEVDGTKTHHLKFTQDQFDWEIWVPITGDPVLRKSVLDLTKSIANSPLAAQFKGKKLEATFTYKGWKIDQDLDKAVFAFEPPKDSKKVDSFNAGGPGGAAEEAPSPLIGKPAPAISLKKLEKGDFSLADERDKHPVMIDFWATWCGPCVMELPILADVAKQYKEKGVVFVAVNLREKPDEIKTFLKEKKLDVTVALDSDGATGDTYKVEGIPTLVLIDTKGVVQAVHVGYNPAIKTTLPKELDDLLAGKDLSKEADKVKSEPKPKPAAPKVPKPAAPEVRNEGLEPAWSVVGDYACVATGRHGKPIFALRRSGRCDVLDSEGKSTRSFRVPGQALGVARVARMPGGSEGLIAFGPWGPSVLAVKGDGTKAWEEKGGQGIDDARTADLDGDGVDETIVGYNGRTGLHVFDASGKRLWKRTDLGNVWHVTAGDTDGDGKPEVITTSAAGRVHLFAATDGKPIKELSAGIYADMVRTAPARAIAGSKGDVILVGGSMAAGGEAITALASDGRVYWKLDLPAGTITCDSLEVSSDGAWAAVGVRGGAVHVVDVGKGKIVAQIGGQGMIPMVAWAATGDHSAPLLLVASGSAVNAFRVKPGPVASGNDHR